MKKLNKLSLNQETLRNLSATELQNVVGGFATKDCSGLNCTVNTCPCVCFGTCPPPAKPAK
jgi:natural product precursor